MTNRSHCGSLASETSLQTFAPGARRERVLTIAKLMASGEWPRGGGQIGKDLCEQWGVGKGALENYSAEAGRLLDIVANSKDRLEEMCRVRLTEIAQQDGDDRVRALEVLLKNIGRLRDKQDVTVTHGDPESVLKRAAVALVRDPSSREMLIEQLRTHAPEVLAPELRTIETTGEAAE